MNSEPEITADSVYENRRQILAWVHLAAGIALTVFIAIHTIEDCCYELSFMEGLLVLVMLFSYWRIRKGASLALVEKTLMTSAVILFSSLVIFESIEHTGIIWAAGMPFVAYFVLKAIRARYWVSFFVVELIVIALLEVMHVFDTSYSATQILCLVAVIFFYWVLADIFKSQLESRQQLLNDSYRNLEDQQLRMQVILDHSPIGIWMVDTESHIQFLNKAVVNWSGISEELARQTDNYSTLLPESLAQEALLSDQACLQGETVHYLRESFPCADGQKRTFDMIKVKLSTADGEAQGLVGFAIDITEKLHTEIEQQALERQIQHSQRLESLGVMAGGIAHDFNNLLTAIQGSIELARLEKNLSQNMLESLDCIDTASKAATDLCRQMLAYSGKGLFKAEYFQICDLVEDMRGLLEISIGKHVSLHFQRQPYGCHIHGDRGQINQVLLNLAINASEAIGEDKQGQITITVDQKEVRANESVRVFGAALKPGLYNVMAVEDNGCGMVPEIVEHMFDPFFTTKFTGRGLGMSAILGILRAHEAGLEVVSKPGEGTTMSVWLPHQSGMMEDAAVAHTEPEVVAGRVLLVDDEQAVLNVAKRMLERLGLSVVATNRGKEAVDLYSRDPSFDWILLDVTMPEMDGTECLERFRAINPELYVVFSSGYDAESTLTLSGENQPDDFLNKPYTFQALKAVVDKVQLHLSE